MQGFLGRIHSNMVKSRILIVEDQADLRAVFKSGIETLDADIDVVTVPSGEEAMLEIACQPYDLLVADVDLPGISGLELVTKLQKRGSAIKVIFITGMVDPQIRRAVADAGVDAYFLKPIEMTEFLDAVERSLGLIKVAPLDQDVNGIEKPFQGMTDRLIDLRQELDAISAIILDDHGRALVRAGDLPDASMEAGLYQALMAVFGASERVAKYLATSPPDDLMYFAGSKFDILLAHIGIPYALVIALNPLGANDEIDTFVQMVRVGLKDLLNMFEHIGVTITPTEYTELQKDEVIVEDAVDAQLIESMFETKAALNGVDAFWDTAVKSSKPEAGKIDELSFEQAQQLGLTPEDPDQDARSKDGESK